jgi:acyl-CoA synthetase (AMP-forming)/AMP-acid ligase II
VGVPDPRWGERVTAVVQPRAGRRPKLEDINALCRSKLAGYKLPRNLLLVDEVMRSPAGKPDYGWARSRACEAFGAAPRS